ncbi:MAG: tryptophan synthase subunit beta [Clostridiales bacterium]|nr:tryptophan synthase subunit beta [Clostridiales bacterium]MCD8216413.1 tryptophan synthase subunit beta [Clostridiales bacterium]
MSKDFGIYGGQYVPESLMTVLKVLEKEFETYGKSEEFKEEYMYYMRQYVGRPSVLYYAENLTKALGGAKIYLKREDLNHTGAHKINNAIAQALLAKHMGKTKVIAETGAGQHGVATATVAALFGMDCEVYMGTEDIERQKLNVFRMELLGSRVVPVSTGTGTLKDATNEAIRTWVARAEDTFYIIGSAVGPHPYPTMVRDFQRIIGDETRKQILEAEGRLPDRVYACVGGGSNSIGMFYPFIEDKDVKLIGVEAAGKGIETGLHASAFSGGKVGILHGMKSSILQDNECVVKTAYSISAGLDYPGVGPEHAYLHDIGRVNYTSIKDDESIEAFKALCRYEGIMPAIESSHALAQAMKEAPQMSKDDIIVICLSGRGDKDVHTVAKYLGKEI